MFLDNTILNALPNPIILINDQREVVGANTAATELLGTITRGRDLSLSLRHPDILAAVDAVLAGATHEISQVSFSRPVTRTFELSITHTRKSTAAAEGDIRRIGIKGAFTGTVTPSIAISFAGPPA